MMRVFPCWSDVSLLMQFNDVPSECPIVWEMLVCVGRPDPALYLIRPSGALKCEALNDRRINLTLADSPVPSEHI